MPNVLASYMQGQQAVENSKRNRLLDLQLQNAPAEQERSNRLADLQLQRQRQVVDAGGYDQSKQQEIDGLKRGIAGAQYVAQSKTPKLDAEKRYPEFVAELRKNGMDWDSLDDDGVREFAGGLVQQLSAKAGIGPPDAGPKFTTEDGPRGSLLQVDPRTGERKQIVPPGEDFKAKAEFTDKLARARDTEQRDFQRQQAKEKAGVDKELAKIRAASVGEKPTDGQRLSAGFLARMQDTEPSFGSYVPSTKDYVLYNKILKNQGGFLGSGTAAELNKKLPAQAQEYFQQVSDWVRAKLRKESGAVITPEEMLSEITTYFPLPGDSPKAVENKARSRATAVEAMAIAAGSVGDKLPPPAPRGEQPTPPAAAPAASGASNQPQRVTSEAEYNQLPSGTMYIGPDGKMRQKR